MSQNRAEALDDDKVGGDYPPEEPLAVEDYGTTAAEEGVDEPLEERLAREEPEGDVDAGAEPDRPVDDVVQEHEGPIPAEEAAVHPLPEDDL